MKREASVRAKKARRPPPPGEVRKRAPRGPGRARGVALALALGLALALAAGWFAYVRFATPRPPAAAAPDPLAGMDPRAAFDTGLRIAEGGEDIRSLPYLRRAAAGIAGYSRPHYELSTALTNAALEVRVRQGRVDPALRSTVERIGSVLEGEREMQVALEQAHTPHDAAVLLFQRASTYTTWGMHADALGMLRLAHDIDPAWQGPIELIAVVEKDIARGGARP